MGIMRGHNTWIFSVKTKTLLKTHLILQGLQLQVAMAICINIPILRVGPGFTATLEVLASVTTPFQPTIIILPATSYTAILLHPLIYLRFQGFEFSTGFLAFHLLNLQFGILQGNGVPHELQ